MPNNHIATSYVVEVTNPNVGMWRAKWPWLDKECRKSTLYIHDTEIWGIRVPHIIRCTSLIESQISISFVLRHVGFELQGKYIKWPQTDLEHYRGCIVYVLLVSLSPKFQPVLVNDWPFSSYKTFWDKCTEWTQMTLNPTRSNLPNICYWCLWVPNFCQFRSTTRSLEQQAILRRVHRTTPNDLENYKAKYIPYMCYVYACVPNVTPFCSTTSHFQDTRLSKIKLQRMTSEWHWTIQSTLYTQSTYPQDTNFAPFRSTTSHFREKRLSKIGKLGNAPNDTRITRKI